ncbi:MAG TPA: hypothetical protein VFB12_10655 [Ktedonobacteraceae bacterium]|nr:hypothetical protein [Ktedonobacteraceae bacterium]
MQLNERLQICLLAVAHRYPHHTIDINETIFELRGKRAEGWNSLALIEQFQRTQPALLQAPARLIVNDQKSVISLTEYSEDTPAFSIHCRGRIPVAMKGLPENSFTSGTRGKASESLTDSLACALPALIILVWRSKYIHFIARLLLPEYRREKMFPI